MRIRTLTLIVTLVLMGTAALATVDLEAISPNNQGQWRFGPGVIMGFPSPTPTSTPAQTPSPLNTTVLTATPAARPTEVVRVEGLIHTQAVEDGYGLLQEWGRGVPHLWVRENWLPRSERGICGQLDNNNTPCTVDADCTGINDGVCHHVPSGRNFELIYNSDPLRSGWPETGLRQGGGGFASDTLSVEFSGNGTTNQISLVDRHSDPPNAGADNRFGVDIIRSKFGPSVTALGSNDTYRRIGPSSMGSVPELVNQQYEVLARADQTASIGNGQPVCQSTTAHMAHICNAVITGGDLPSSVIGVLEENSSTTAGALFYFTQSGFVSNMNCVGTINPGDRLRIDTTGRLVSDPNTSAASVVGVAASTCSGNKVDIWVSSKGAASSKVWMPAARCLGSTATIGIDWSTLTATAPTQANCLVGTNTVTPVLEFADSVTQCAQTSTMLPLDWGGSVSVKMRWTDAATSGSVQWLTYAVCVADAELDDQSFGSNPASLFDNSKTVANWVNDKSVDFTPTQLSTCSAGEMLHIQLCRFGADANDSMLGTARLIGIELSIGR